MAPDPHISVAWDIFRTVDFFGERTIDAFLAEHGQFYRWGRAADMKRPRGKLKQCYMNAIRMGGGDWAYTEGKAMSADLIPVDHAWLTNPDGEVWDCTWRARTKRGKSPRAYFGIRFDHKEAYRESIEAGYYGVLCPGGMRKTPIATVKPHIRPVKSLPIGGLALAPYLDALCDKMPHSTLED